MKKFLLGLILIGLQTGCSSEIKKQPTEFDDFEKPLILEDILKAHMSLPKDVVGWLRKCQTRCKSPDREIAESLADGYQILFELADKKPNYSQLSSEEKVKAQVGQRKVHTAFLKILETKEGRDILETAYRELSNPQSLYAGDKDFERLLLVTIERLKNKPETRATGWYLQAISIPPLMENILAVIGSYRECLLNSKEDQACLSGYSDVVRFYERPRCKEPEFHLKNYFYSASKKKKSPSDRIIKIKGENIYVERTPVLASEDLLEATLEFIQADRFEIWLSLKTFSIDKLTKYTEKAAKEPTSILLMASNQTVLNSAPVRQKIADGQFRMIYPNLDLAKKSFAKLCKKPSPDLLPENLRLKN